MILLRGSGKMFKNMKRNDWKKIISERKRSQ